MGSVQLFARQRWSAGNRLLVEQQRLARGPEAVAPAGEALVPQPGVARPASVFSPEAHRARLAGACGRIGAGPGEAAAAACRGETLVAVLEMRAERVPGNPGITIRFRKSRCAP